VRKFLGAIGGVFAALVLAGCTGPAEPKWASDELVARAAYVHDGPTELTLFTVVSNDNNAGAHAALMVNADQRIIFDPAGTWYHPHLPERNDVHYGLSDPIVDFYLDYHTRITYHTVIQTLQVTPAQAAAARRAAEAYGAVPKAQCTLAVARVLQQVQGFEDAPVSYFPKVLMRYFAEQPGVVTRTFRDYDSDDNSGVIQAPPAAHVMQAQPSG